MDLDDLLGDISTGRMIKRILSTNPPTNEREYEVIIHTKYQDYKEYTLIYLDLFSNYVEAVGDITTIEVLIPLGILIHELIPNQELLEITLLMTIDGKVYKDRYRGILLNIKDLYNKFKDVKMDNLNKDSYHKVRIQCMDLYIEAIRVLDYSVILERARLNDVVRHSIEQIHHKIKLANKTIKDNIDVDIVPLDNNSKYEHIIIPDGIKLIELSTYLQEKYGLYNGGVNTYFYLHEDKPHIATYPLYRVRDELKNRLHIWVIPDTYGKMATSTYATDKDNVVHIIASAEDKLVEAKDTQLLDKGESLKVREGKTVLNRTLDIDPYNTRSKQIKLRRKDTTKNTALTHTQSGIVNSRKTVITDNQYKYRTEVLKDSGMEYKVQWNFSMPEFLLPGMQVSVYLTEGSNVLEHKGILQRVFTYVDNNNQMAISVLDIWLQEKSYIHDKVVYKKPKEINDLNNQYFRRITNDNKKGF